MTVPNCAATSTAGRAGWSARNHPPGLAGDGLFYGFATDVPRVVPAGSAAAAAGGGDAVFSLVPGVSALYFFHEGEVWARGRA